MAQDPANRASRSSSHVNLTSNSSQVLVPGLTKVNSNGQPRSQSVSGPTTPVPSQSWVSQRPVNPSRSLYNQCKLIMLAMKQIPELEAIIEMCASPTQGENDVPQINIGIAPQNYALDPVSHLWRILRLGSPLCILFNALLRVDENGETVQLEVLSPTESCNIKSAKKMVYHFLQACITVLKLRPEEDLFTITNMFSDSTSDLLKVLHTVEVLLKMLVDEARITSIPTVKDIELPAAQSQRDNVVLEIVNTERKYVQDLELMQQYNDAMLAGNMPREMVQAIFPYLSRIVDFQRRFLVGLEYHARLPMDEQQFHLLFSLLKQEFHLYESYTLNQREASGLALANSMQLMAFSDIMEPNHELQAMLIKPVQRICKYPLLLKQIAKSTPQAVAYYPALLKSMDIMHGMTLQINEAQRKSENEFYFNELREQLKDWRGLNADSMGELLLRGQYPVITMDSAESEYYLYLFEHVLLCCKDSAPVKKGGLSKMRAPKPSKRTSMDLKGRIYITYVTGVTVTKTDTGSYILSITWGRENAPETGTFDFRLFNEEQAQLWEQSIQKLISEVRARSLSDITTAYEDENNDTKMAQFYDDMPPQSPVDNLSLRKLSTSSLSYNPDLNGRSRSTSEANIYRPGTIGSRISNGSQTTFVSSPTFVHHHSESTIPTVSHPFNGRRGTSTSSGSIEEGSAGLNMGTMSSPQFVEQPGEFNPARYASRSSVRSNSSRFGHLELQTSNLGSPSHHPASAHPSLHDQSKLLVRLHYQVESYLIQVNADTTYEVLLSRVERKLHMCGKQFVSPLKLKYQDEDEDFVTLASTDDLQMATDCMLGDQLNIWVV
ncbi:Rho guanine nucleotide exchange factor scd1 [Wickerhamiella sorbophila]|uniref:Rho guanine nucleotide exchange factor scd1 n=1 Tax=Wickerhamiella sorbophila TaxID=45607 RepID=A0A2T0FQ47_9ASCO|nr:Rho guanine nucleotide exchange factor scd1 [Wickerhamiella sorbophila]PRT57100.1 Rho guanine nucleotide exchange factor scd1 [Wickerhamiella sorbophila]